MIAVYTLSKVMALYVSFKNLKGRRIFHERWLAKILIMIWSRQQSSKACTWMLKRNKVHWWQTSKGFKSLLRWMQNSNLFLSTKRLQKNFSYFTVIMPTFLKPSTFSEWQCLSFFSRIQELFRRTLWTIIISQSVDKRSNSFRETHSIWIS